MLFVRWNKNGSKVNCEKSQLEEMKKNGYEFEKCPEEVEEIEKVEKEKEVKAEPKKTRQSRKKKEESDIVLE